MARGRCRRTRGPGVPRFGRVSSHGLHEAQRGDGGCWHGQHRAQRVRAATSVLPVGWVCSGVWRHGVVHQSRGGTEACNGHQRGARSTPAVCRGIADRCVRQMQQRCPQPTTDGWSQARGAMLVATPLHATETCGTVARVGTHPVWVQRASAVRRPRQGPHASTTVGLTVAAQPGGMWNSMMVWQSWASRGSGTPVGVTA